jgi:hypothetical protein
MKINPTKLSWTAPTTNTDGTEITYDLEYEVGQVTSTGTIISIMVVASQLQPDGQYEIPLEDITLDYGEHTLVMCTFAKDNPYRKSAWSAGVSFILSAEIPNVPLGLTAY